MKNIPIGTALVLIALVAGSIATVKFVPDSGKEIAVVLNVLMAWLIQSPIPTAKPVLSSGGESGSDGDAK